MDGRIILTQPSAYLLLCVLAAVGMSALLYFRTREWPPGPRLGMALLRGLAVGLLAFLLLGPLLRRVTPRTQRPTLLIAEDASASAKAEVDALAPALDGFAERLSDRFDVERLRLGERVRPRGDTAADAATDLSALFAHARERYPPELLAGIVVATDGIYNQGADPSYAAAELLNPTYALPVGDTTPQRDVAVREVLHNRIGYLGDRLEIRVDVLATGLSGSGAAVRLSGDGADASERVRFDRARDLETVRFEVTPTRAGLQRYRVSVPAVGGERNTANNTREVFIDVLDARQRILLLAEAPHPDVSALRQALDANDNYETEYALLSRFDGDASEADLVIFHGVGRSAARATEVLGQLDGRKVGRWFITGARPLAAGLTLQHLFGLSAKPNTNVVTPALNEGFRLFGIGEAWAERLRGYPPVSAPFGDYGLLAAGEALLTQRVGRVETDYPLLAMGEVAGTKEGVFAGEGLWRWRLAEYQATGGHEAFDAIVLATVQYLALRDDRRPFRVTPSQRVYTTNESVRLRGELYNASFQLVNEPDVAVAVSEAGGARYDFVMDKVGGAYRLRAGRLPPGDYTYRATTGFAGEAYEATGAFSIQRVDLEEAVTTADWDLLRRMSAARGGRTVTAAELDGLAEELIASSTAKPVLYQRVRTRPLVDWPWLLAAVLVLLAAEWFWRRRLGGY